MTTGPRLGVGLRVAVVHSPPAAPDDVVDRPSRLSEVLDPAWLDDVACAGEMVSVNRLRAALDAYEVGVVARLADLRPDFWEETDTPGRPAEGWSPVREFVGVSEFFVDEVAAVLGISRTRAHTVANTALVLVGQLPATWHALADGHIDLARARALVHVLGWQQPEVSADVVAAVEAEALGWAIAGEGPYRLQDRTAALLLERDAEAADRARKRAEREADVQVHGRRDGLADLTVTLQPDIAAACRDTADRYARMWKADGDDRPIGLLRTLVLADLVLRPWDTSRPPITAHITIHAPLPALVPPRIEPDPGDAERPPAPPPADGVVQPGTVGGLPVTSAHLRELMARWSDAGLDGLTAPEDGSLDLAVTDPHTGRLRAVVTGPELRRVAARGCPQHPGADTPSCGCPLLESPPATSHHRLPPHRRPTPVHRRPRPGLPPPRLLAPGPLDRCGPRRRPPARRPDGLRQPVHPVPSAPPAQDARTRLAVRDDGRRRPLGHHALRRHPHHPTTRDGPRPRPPGAAARPGCRSTTPGRARRDDPSRGRRALPAGGRSATVLTAPARIGRHRPRRGRRAMSLGWTTATPPAASTTDRVPVGRPGSATPTCCSSPATAGRGSAGRTG
jgi:hypothetical protein